MWETWEGKRRGSTNILRWLNNLAADGGSRRPIELPTESRRCQPPVASAQPSALQRRTSCLTAARRSELRWGVLSAAASIEALSTTMGRNRGSAGRYVSRTTFGPSQAVSNMSDTRIFVNTYPIFWVRPRYVSEAYPRRIRIRYVSDTGYAPLLKYPCIVGGCCCCCSLPQIIYYL
jgi:hypothetical protein